MNIPEILADCNKIFIDELGNPSIVLKPESTASDIEEWDSLTHIQLIVAIEKHFKIRFTTAEIQNFKNVGEMCTCIQKRISK